MTKVLPRKPGPKSSKQSRIAKNRGTLGDTSVDDASSAEDASADDDGSGNDAVNARHLTTSSTKTRSSKRLQPNTDTSEFQTPELENDATDYGLEFTTSNIQNPSPRRCSTLRTGGSSQEEQTANRNASKPVDETSERHSQAKQQSTVNDNETPTTSMHAQLLAKSKPLRKVTQPTKSKTAANPKNTQTPAPQTSAVVTNPARKRRKQRNPMQLEKRFWKEVRILQNRTDNLIPMLPFSRVVREVMLQSSTTVTKITPTALQAIQVSSEMYLTQRLQDAYMLTLHRGRVTLEVRDMQLLNYLNI